MNSGRRASDQPGMREFIAFLRRVCQLLTACGCSANRVEMLTQILGNSWGFEVETLAIPTGVWIAVRRDGHGMVDLTRVQNWSVDLDLLARVNELVEEVNARRLTIEEAHARLTALIKEPPPYGKLVTLAAGGVASAVLIRLYGGTWLEAGLGLPIGVATQYLSKYLFAKSDNRRYLADTLCAGVVAGYARLFQHFIPEVDVPRLIVGGIVVLIPGLVLVNAVHEVAQKNLVSGAAKLLEALMITTSLGCGVVFVLGMIKVLS